MKSNASAHFAMLFLCLFISCKTSQQTNGSSSLKIKNTSGFIDYFKGVENVINYIKVKDSAQKFAKEIKSDESISSGDKTLLKQYYTTLKDKSDNLFEKIEADLMSSEQRKKIKANVDDYVKSINVLFLGIDSANSDFKNKYSSIKGATKGGVFVWVIVNFILPIAKEFVKEIITDLIKAEIDKRLKPLIVIKPWDEI